MGLNSGRLVSKGGEYQERVESGSQMRKMLSGRVEEMRLWGAIRFCKGYGENENLNGRGREKLVLSTWKQ